MSKKLLSGYTTGTHATAVFGAVLSEYFLKTQLNYFDVILPKSTLYAKIKVKRQNRYHYSTVKVDNDDLDVTKGCCIYAKLFLKTPKDLKNQKPSSIKVKDTTIFIYGGDGVGIVTKNGLKIEPNYPAINPVPLDMMKEVAKELVKQGYLKNLHIVISVDDGEKIAKQTANQKVGVIGGISILGTKGIVKPVSADAYIDSIEAEISVIDASKFNEIVFTLGNTAYDYAINHYEAQKVVEIGNYIYDASKKLKGTNFKKMIFITSVAKMCKIAQGFKNTHNRFGSIDFKMVDTWLKEEVGVNLGADECLTLKATLEKLTTQQTKHFLNFLGSKAGENFKKWLLSMDIKIQELDIITLNNSEVSKGRLVW